MTRVYSFGREYQRPCCLLRLNAPDFIFTCVLDTEDEYEEDDEYEMKEVCLTLYSSSCSSSYSSSVFVF